MKLLSSDYDGTLNIFEYDIHLNLSYIRSFMKEGNIFVLNTGREFKRIIPEIEKYGIPYNYLSCTDGNLLLNSSNQVVYQTCMKDNIKEILLELRKSFKDIRLEPIFHNDSILEYQLVTNEFNEKLLLSLEKICLLHNLCYKIFHIEKQVYIYICRNDISKSTAIEKIRELEKISKCDIFTVGDDLNDFEMIRDFKGYTFPWGNEKLKSVSQGVCTSVADLVKKISK